MHVDGYLRLAGFTARNYSPSKGSTMAQHSHSVVKWIQSDLYTHFSPSTPSPMHTHLHNHHLLLAALLVTAAHTKAQLRGENVTYCQRLSRFHRTEFQAQEAI